MIFWSNIWVLQWKNSLLDERTDFFSLKVLFFIEKLNEQLILKLNNKIVRWKHLFFNEQINLFIAKIICYWKLSFWWKSRFQWKINVSSNKLIASIKKEFMELKSYVLKDIVGFLFGKLQRYQWKINDFLVSKVEVGSKNAPKINSEVDGKLECILAVIFWRFCRLFLSTVDVLDYAKINLPEIIDFMWFSWFCIGFWYLLIVFHVFVIGFSLVFHCSSMVFLEINRPSA